MNRNSLELTQEQEVRMAVMEEERQRSHHCRATQDQVATGRGAHSHWVDAGGV